jgi:hypothetical protein
VPISYDDVELSTPRTGWATAEMAMRAERARAVRVVASAALDAADCAHLLDVLGLSGAEAQPVDGAVPG